MPFAFTIDPNVAEHPSFPNDLFVASYNGVLTSKLLATFQVSQKKFGFRGCGGFDTDIHASPFITQGVAEGVDPGGLHYNGNYFDATDPEDRDNRQVAGSLSYFLTTPGLGTHDIKGGFEHFTSNQHRRQLAERQRLRVRHRLPATARRAGVRRERPHHPGLRRRA